MRAPNMPSESLAPSSSPDTASPPAISAAAAYPCLYCGANPAPHGILWIAETFAVLTRPLDLLLARSGLQRLADYFGDLLVAPLFHALRALGIARYNTDRTKITSFRGKALWEEAERRGIEMKSITFFGKEMDMYEARIKTAAPSGGVLPSGGALQSGAMRETVLRFASLPRPASPAEDGIYWIDDKAALKEKLSAAGVPVPRGRTFARYAPLRAYFEELEKPVIVKPRLGSRGRHTTTFIYTEKQLAKAYEIAKRLCNWVILEEHLTGSVYRGTAVNGEIVGVLGGDPPRVTGNGRAAIAELIAQKNASKMDGVKDAIVTPLTVDFLARNGLALETVLPAGRTIDISEKIGVNYGGASVEVTDETHPETKRILGEAARAVNDPLIGFDFIIEDIARAPHGQKWGIIECNSLPFINLHHYPLIGKPVNVAKYVWDLWQPRKTEL